MFYVSPFLTYIRLFHRSNLTTATGNFHSWVLNAETLAMKNSIKVSSNSLTK